jgi:putative ABC transport system permease protein
VLCIAAVGIAVFFVIFMQSYMDGMINSIEKVVRTFDTGDVNAVSSDFEADKEYYPVQFPLAEGESVSTLERQLKTIPEVKALFPRIMAYATLQDSTVKHALLWGIKIQEETAFQDFNKSKGTNGLVLGRYPEEGTNECAIGTRMVKKSGLGIGDHIPLKTVSAQFSDKMWNPVITGIFEFEYMKYDEDVILVNFERLQRLLVLGEATQQLFIFGGSADQSRSIANQARILIPGENIIREWRDNYAMALMQQSMSIFIVIYLVFLIVASFLIVNTVVMIIHERIKEIGMMGSLGMTRREIVEVFFFESVILSVLGALAGCLVGGITCFVLSFFPLDFNALTGGGFKEFPISGTITLVFNWGLLLQGFFMGVIISSICTLIPSLKSAFVEPVEALRR